MNSHFLAEALRSCKTCPKALGLVCLKQKYGVRVYADDGEVAFKQLKPEATFIAARVQRTFQLFPLPHGLQRAELIRRLKDLGWLANHFNQVVDNKMAYLGRLAHLTHPSQHLHQFWQASSHH